jgi:PAS domain S-box-containing protein
LGRKRVEQSLRETRALTTVLLEDSPVPTAVINADFSIRYVNRAMEQLSGYSSREMIGRKPPFPWWQAEDVEADLGVIRQAVSEGGLVAEKVFRRKTGEQITVQIVASPVSVEAGSKSLLVTCFDITERKRAEELLRLQRDLGIALSTTASLDVALEEILKVAAQIDSIDCGGVYLLDSDKAIVSLAAHRGLSSEFVSRASAYSTDTERGRLVLAGRPIHQHFDRYAFPPDGVVEHEGLKALAVIPVEYEGKVVAALNLASRTHEDIPAADRNAAEAIATQVGAAIARVRAAAALRQSQRNLENLFNTLDDLAFVLDQNGNIVHVNRTAEKRLGYALEELAGRPVLDLHPPDRRREAGEIVAAMVDGTTSVCPIPVLAKDGTLIEVETKVSRGEWDGRPVLFGISRDIGDRIRAEKRLQTENAFREAVIHGAAEGLCVCRDAAEYPHLRFDVWNHRMVEITGYTREEINRLGWYETLHSEEPRRQQAREYAAAVQAGQTFRAEEWLITRADGERRTLLVSATPIHTVDGPLRMLGVVQDITERKQMERALAESKQKLAGMLNAVTDHISMMDEQYNIVWANEVARGLFGAAVVGRKCYEVYHGKEEPCESCVTRRTFADGKSHEHETKVVSADGERDFWCTSSVAARHEDGRPKLVMEISRDVTDRKRAEEQSRKHLAELAHVMRLTTMGEMASGMAHELNQPLTAIATYAGACSNTLQQTPSPTVDKATEILDRIEQQAIRAGRIIHRLRSFVSRTPPARVARDMNEIVREVLVLAGAELRTSRITVRLDLDESIPNVLVDAIQIQQVLLNLVKNAREAMAGESDDRRELTIETGFAEPNTVEVAVGDSGTGVCAADADQVFDAFFTTKPDGMGMGLAISRSIAESHGGRLSFTPNSDRGCTFRFAIPALRDKPSHDVRRAEGTPR